MLQVLLSIEIVIALALVGTILLQQSEGGALGMGGGPGGGSGGGLGGFMSARGAANLLTRATAILAFLFIGVALTLAVISGQRSDGTSVFDNADLATPFNQEEVTDDLAAPLSLDDDLPSLDEPPAEPADEEGDGE